MPLAGLHNQQVSAAGNKQATLEEVERRTILEVLKSTDWVVSGPRGAAALLGLKRSTLQCRMDKLGSRQPHSRVFFPPLRGDMDSTKMKSSSVEAFFIRKRT